MTMTSYTFWHGRRSLNNSDNNADSSNARNRYSFVSRLDHILSGLRQNTWTASLYIDGHWWQRDDVPCQEEAVQLFDSLSDNTSCGILIFQNVTLQDAASQAFVKCMASNNHKLKSISLRNLRLRLSGNTESAADADSIYPVPPSLFEQAQNLESLSLTKVALDYEACVALSQLLLCSYDSDSNSSSLKSLSLDQVQMDERGMLPFCAALVRTRCLKSLKVSNLGQASSWWNNNKFHMERFCLALSYNKSITTLYVDDMRLGTFDNTHNHAASKALAKLLRTNRTLTQLSLRRNGLDGNAVQILLLQQGLMNNRKSALEHLFLSRNALGDTGAAHLATFFAKQQHLQSNLHTLCLVDTKISHAGCVQILQSLQQNTMVKKIVLDGNEVGDLAPALLELLQRYNNVHLTYVLDRLLAHLARAQRGIASGNNSSKNFQAWRQVDLLLRANKAGRRVLQPQQRQHNHVNLVSRVLSRAAVRPTTTSTTTSSDVLFFSMQNHVAPQLRFVGGPTDMLSSAVAMAQPRSNSSLNVKSSSSLTSVTTPVLAQHKTVAPSA